MLAGVTTPHDLDQRFRAAVAELAEPILLSDPGAPLVDGAALSGAAALEIFDAQLTARHLDLAGRWLRSFGAGYQGIPGAGHESTAAVAYALRPTDPALLHHRSAAFYCVRAAQHGVADPATALLRSAVGSAADPGSGGRHRSYGDATLHTVPTTGRHAGHLPRAVGVAYAIDQGALDPGAPGPWPADAIAVASFGDGAVEYADLLTATALAGWLSHGDGQLPLLLVCEDNGLSGGVRGRPGRVEAVLRGRPGLRYLGADGGDLVGAYETALDAAAWVRRERRPAVLHLRTVRLLGHDVGDAERSYRPAAELAADAENDPLLGTAALLVDAGLRTTAQVAARYDEIGWQVRQRAEQVIAEAKHDDPADLTAPIAPRRPARVARAVAEAAAAAATPARSAAFGGALPEDGPPLTLAGALTAALTDVLLSHPRAVLFGPDVANRGGDHRVTAGLRRRFGPQRVFDTPADESAVVGLGLGAGLGGVLPLCELPELASLRRADEQLRGQAATLGFLSAGALRNPLVLRVPGLGYDPRGQGLPADDHALAALRDAPGLVVGVPARAADAAGMLRACATSAAVDGSVCVLVEPTALYHATDLHADGDGAWTDPYPPPQRWADAHVPIGRARTYEVGSGADLTVLTFGNGVRLSLRAAHALAADGVGSRVVDLRWLNPLPVADLAREAAATGRVLIVDETRRSGGVGEGVIAALLDAGFVGAARRVAAADSFIPVGPAAQCVLVGEDAIREGADALLGR
ncbi:MFS transporter [Pilimelia terevasa]|uniref:MFS transporter n=1 Tax=Pilimelia terevasa TaxID=53372 RepID=A0A8J3BJU9_9ACTN|nr:transketolase C-terminal domain-containing protein [Pilimelia terevasa]GGK19629.1 MFS transporter [Pilimelia terevasa]